MFNVIRSVESNLSPFRLLPVTPLDVVKIRLQSQQTPFYQGGATAHVHRLASIKNV